MDNVFKLTLSLTAKGKRLVIRKFKVTSQSMVYISVISTEVTGDFEDTKMRIKKSQLNTANVTERIIKTSEAIYIIGWSDQKNLTKIEEEMWDILHARFHEIQEHFNVLQRVYHTTEATTIIEE